MDSSQSEPSRFLKRYASGSGEVELSRQKVSGVNNTRCSVFKGFLVIWGNGVCYWK